ncbi:putative disease resistance protein RGA3 [Morella rubra]|uniref:Putative disease resistance protein RGA3 n=1 Tax=Morella rubra TaxID=262757 RepID=A0A6A1WNR3_9ROSI|nr:putative disease resistance protein RGA3 [Morella rubra]
MDEFGNIVGCKMHDFMHDLAVKVSGSSLVTLDSKNKFLERKTRHVAIEDTDFVLADPTLSSKIGSMRTLFFQGKISHSESETTCVTESTLNAIFSNLKLLRTLDLQCQVFDVVPISISKLKRLRYLDLSENERIKKLPYRSITRLQNLHNLRLTGCWRLEELPRDIKKLVNLRHLEIQGCGCLTNPMTLSQFVVNPDGGVMGDSGGLDELNRLNGLRGKLEIRGLVHGKDVESEYKTANLKDKQHLHTLELVWTRIGGEMVDDDTQLEGLEPHSNLKKLSMKYYGGYILDSGDNMISTNSLIPNVFFPSLKEIYLYCCPKFKGWWRRMDPVLPSFPLLSDLTIAICPMLTFMPTFPHLERLELKIASWKPMQQTMTMNVAALESRSTVIACPTLIASSSTPLSKLTSLQLHEMEDLRCLPEKGLRNLISLKDLSILACSKLKTLSRGIQHLTALQKLQLRNCIELDLGKDRDSAELVEEQKNCGTELDTIHHFGNIGEKDIEGEEEEQQEEEEEIEEAII